eukprot:3818744-Prymnesium_polylepis.2
MGLRDARLHHHAPIRITHRIIQRTTHRTRATAPPTQCSTPQPPAAWGIGAPSHHGPRDGRVTRAGTLRDRRMTRGALARAALGEETHFASLGSALAAAADDHH